MIPSFNFGGPKVFAKRLGAAFFILCLCSGLLWLAAGFFPLPHPLAKFDFSTLVLDQKGRILRLSLTKDDKYRLRCDLEKLPRWALEKVISYEDRFFWQHPGVNVLALARSALSMFLGSRRLGGSTLTMQTVRLAYGLKTTSLLGKLKQIVLALWLERSFNKSEILEAYFSLAPYGGNIEGLGSAALIYFHK
ncbi:MAG: transglycosylase domain-containing protein, partial [Desulfovibrio sp.]|nr:transglycosylase domain-containing protein [Desulfovibrio sp.]